MRTQASTMENKENMIFALIRRFNAAVLKYILTAKLRTIGATILGALGGLSLVSNIIPSAMEYSGIIDSFSARWELGGFAVYTMIIWGFGARSTQKIGSKIHGAIILGAVGCASALIVAGVGINTELYTLMTAGGVALFYGAFGGLLIADAFRSPPVDENDSDAPTGCIGDLGIFRNLKK
ncbi:MAG TPA: hypothetical protein HPP94_01030 [Desulfuromonadales bacterium]|nr:hypothetical protein [Desulfuromonadales bacterium]